MRPPITLPAVGSIMLVRQQPGRAAQPERKVELLEDLGEKKARVRYLHVDREAEITIGRLVTDEQRRVVVVG